MADSASESDSGSVDGVPGLIPPSPVNREQLYKRVESLQQQNRVLKVELETYKLRVKSLQEENRHLRQASVNIQAKAEQEEEFISNTLLKKIQALRKEKETLAHHYEQEEECLTNDLSRKLNQLRQEKCKLEQTLEQEQECVVNKLMRKIEKLEAETNTKQTSLEQLRREKVELENTLEQEQEALVNRLWKRMDKLEAEKRNLQAKIELGQQGPQNSSSSSQEDGIIDMAISMPPLGPGHSHSRHGHGLGHHDLPHGTHGHGPHGGPHSRDHPPFLPIRLPPSISSTSTTSSTSSTSVTSQGSQSDGLSPRTSRDNEVMLLSSNVQHLRNEVERLKAKLLISQQQHSDKMAQIAIEERQIRDENLRLQRRLQIETERREALCRHLSESESSLEMEDERQFHEAQFAISSNSATNVFGTGMAGSSSFPPVPPQMRGRPPGGASSPGPNMVSSPGSRPISPGYSSMRSGEVIMSPPSPGNKCHFCNGQGWVPSSTPLNVNISSTGNSPMTSASPPIRSSSASGSRQQFVRPGRPATVSGQPSGSHEDQRTPASENKDSIMSSPSPTPVPLEVVMSPVTVTPAASPSPMDTSSSSKI